MSAANTASQALRRNVPPAHSTTAAQRPARPAAQPGRIGFAPKDSEGEFKLNLSDLPRVQESLEVEGFKPTLLSRLLGLFLR